MGLAERAVNTAVSPSRAASGARARLDRTSCQTDSHVPVSFSILTA